MIPRSDAQRRYALMVGGAVVTVVGTIALRWSPAVSIVLVLVGVVAATVGKKLVLRLAATESSSTSTKPAGQERTSRGRLSGTLTACFGYAVGLVVGAVFLVWAVATWDLNAGPGPLTIFAGGLIASVIGLGVSCLSNEWRRSNPSKPIMRFVMNTIICTGALYPFSALAIILAMFGSFAAS